MTREISMLKSYVMKLQFKVTTEENQIVHLKNPFINGIEEKIIEGFNTEALAKNLKGAFMTELEIRKADVDNLQIAAQKKVGDRNIQKKSFSDVAYPCTLCQQYIYYVHSYKLFLSCFSRVSVKRVIENHIYRKLLVQYKQVITGPSN